MKKLPPPPPKQSTYIDTRPPRFAADDLFDLVDPDIRKAFPMHDVILRLVDDSEFSPFKPLYGVNLITGYAHIYGKRMLSARNSQPN